MRVAQHRLGDLPSSVRPFLEEHELLHNVQLGILNRLAVTPDLYPTFTAFLVSDASGIQLYAHHTPPHPLAVSHAPEAAVIALADALRSSEYELEGVHAEADVMAHFLAVWPAAARRVERRGCYEARNVLPATPTTGAARVASVADREFLARWRLDFCIEVGMPPPTDPLEPVDAAIAAGDAVLWTDEGRAVAMAFAGRTMVTGRSVGYVYTPPEARGRGYASNLVAWLSQRLLDAGWQYCCLFTDLDNPTSNKIYQALGYRPVAEFAECQFA